MISCAIGVGGFIGVLLWRLTAGEGRLGSSVNNDRKRRGERENRERRDVRCRTGNVLHDL